MYTIHKKITYISDTQYCKGAIELAEDSDILITEATYAKKLEDKARKYKHLTSEQAGMIANQSNSKKLLLTHFSQRVALLIFLLQWQWHHKKYIMSLLRIFLLHHCYIGIL